MIETPEAVRHAARSRREADFLSIGTNDLVASTLELDRELPLRLGGNGGRSCGLAHVASIVTPPMRGNHRRDLR